MAEQVTNNQNPVAKENQTTPHTVTSSNPKADDTKNIISVQEILGKSAQETQEEYKNFVLSKLNMKMSYPLLDAGISNDKVKQAVEKSSEFNIKGVVGLPSIVCHIQNVLRVTGTPLSVVIGYPFGENSLDNTIRQIGEFAKKKVAEVIVMLSVRDIVYNNMRETDKILKKLASFKKKIQVGVMVDFSMLAEAEVDNLLKKIAYSNLTSLYVCSYKNNNRYNDVMSLKVKTMLSKLQIQVITFAKFETEQEIMQAIKRSDFVLSNKSIDFLERVKNQINL